jgi:hypothetical protein
MVPVPFFPESPLGRESGKKRAIGLGDVPIGEM